VEVGLPGCTCFSYQRLLLVSVYGAVLLSVVLIFRVRLRLSENVNVTSVLSAERFSKGVQ